MPIFRGRTAGKRCVALVSLPDRMFSAQMETQLLFMCILHFLPRLSPSQQSSHAELHARGEQKRGRCSFEDGEGESGRGQHGRARGARRPLWASVSIALQCIPSLLCLCFAFYQYHQGILLSLSVGLLILPSDLWVAVTLYIPAPSQLLQT